MALCNRVMMMIGSFSSKCDNASNYSPLHPTSVGPAGGNYTPTLSHHSNSSSLHVTTTTTTTCDLKSSFLKVYDCLKSELLHDTSFEFDDDSRTWVDRMIDYNIPGGKCTRGLSVVDSYQLLKGEPLSDDELFLACALGWCTEWLQAYMLVTDDIIDDSDLRRGQPCWFRQTEVGMIAVNDALIIRSHIFIILKKHFNGKPYYVDLLELFNEVEYQTISGEMIDLINALVGNTKLSKCSLSTNRRINQYKTSYYSFYLPVACALLLIGENLKNQVQVKDILVEMGIYFTVQDDYLDTYGDPKVFGKIGTDIENGKCSWLIAKALKLSNEEQKKILNESYGRKDPVKVAQVKELYHILNLQGAYEDYENKTHEELMRSIETHPSREVQQVLKSFLEKIYKRQK